MKTNEVENIAKMIEAGEAVLLDVRGEAEYAGGHAMSAEHFDVGRLGAGELPVIPKQMPIYVYCRSGGRAGMAKGFLEEAGFSQVQSIGGLTDWVAGGGSVEE